LLVASVVVTARTEGQLGKFAWKEREMDGNGKNGTELK
jgi:hypothetical protein